MQTAAAGDFLPGYESHFDVALLCETLEHITFNPCKFWKRIHQSLKIGGKVYLSTPNSLSAMNVLSAIKRIVLLEGIGTNIPSIFNTVTYGHHWKEYSRREIYEYFRLLSPDFRVELRTYCYRQYSYRPWNLRDQARRLIRAIGNRSGVFAEELEAIVTLQSKNGKLASAPPFG